MVVEKMVDDQQNKLSNETNKDDGATTSSLSKGKGYGYTSNDEHVVDSPTKK